MTTDYNSFFKLIFRNDKIGVISALSDGADPNFVHPVAGHTPLQMACEANSEDVAGVLLELGADPNQRFTKSSLVTGVKYVNRVALMYAKSPSLVRKLLSFGADVDASDEAGWTSLSLAVEGAFPDVVQTLLECGANRELRRSVLAKHGSLDGLIADKVRFLEDLLKNGSNPKLEALLTQANQVRALL